MSIWVASPEPVELRQNASEDDLETVIQTVYRHVLGNHHVMESQRLTSAESLLRNGDISVRGFVRAVAKSDLYRSLFFETSSSYSFIENNFQNLLGRAPEDQREISNHTAIYAERGFDGEVDSYRAHLVSSVAAASLLTISLTKHRLSFAVAFGNVLS